VYKFRLTFIFIKREIPKEGGGWECYLHNPGDSDNVAWHAGVAQILEEFNVDGARDLTSLLLLLLLLQSHLHSRDRSETSSMYLSWIQRTVRLKSAYGLQFNFTTTGRILKRIVNPNLIVFIQNFLFKRLRKWLNYCWVCVFSWVISFNLHTRVWPFEIISSEKLFLKDKFRAAWLSWICQYV
jgi:hypothetical protein